MAEYTDIIEKIAENDIAWEWARFNCRTDCMMCYSYERGMDFHEITVMSGDTFLDKMLVMDLVDMRDMFYLSYAVWRGEKPVLRMEWSQAMENTSET